MRVELDELLPNDYFLRLQMRYTFGNTSKENAIVISLWFTENKHCISWITVWAVGKSKPVTTVSGLDRLTMELPMHERSDVLWTYFHLPAHERKGWNVMFIACIAAGQQCERNLWERGRINTESGTYGAVALLEFLCGSYMPSKFSSGGKHDFEIYVWRGRHALSP